MLRTRVLAALVFAPALVFAIYLGGLPLRLTCLGLAWLMLWEYARLVWGTGEAYVKTVTFLLGTAWTASLLGLLQAPAMELVLPGATLLVCFAVLMRPQPLSGATARIALIGLGVLYAGGLIPFLSRLRELRGGLGLCATALFCTWGADTGAYFVGRAFGRHKLYPAVSPGKTVEGGIGGTLSAVGVAFFIRWLFHVGLSVRHTLVLGILIAVSGIIGNLVESLIKRSVGAKDSGRLIPGHGGVLDRFDSVMFVAPAVYIYLSLCVP